jgi:hypothetical protein
MTNENNPRVMHDKGMEINFKIGLRKVFSKMIVIIKTKNGFKDSMDVNAAWTSIY